MNDVKQAKFTLTQWRGIKCMTKRALSKKTGISENTILKYETSLQSLRHARYENLESISRALGIKVDDIFLSPTSEKPKLFNKDYILSKKKSKGGETDEKTTN